MLAAAVAAFALTGPDVRPWHQRWVHASQAPLPPRRVALVTGADPEFVPPATVYIPDRGWTPADQRLELFHELGHVFDFSTLTGTDRRRFMKLANTKCRWRAERCPVVDVVCGCGDILNVPPEEMFAEEYAAMSLGLTRRGVEARDLPTYGWMPPPGTEPLMRDLIRSAA